MVSEVRIVVISGRTATRRGQKGDFWAQMILRPWSGCPLHECVHFVTVHETEHTTCVLSCRVVIRQ